MKYRVAMITTTEASVVVEVPDGLGDKEAREAAIEAAYQQGVPGICAQCSGWGKSWGKDESSEWEVPDYPEAVERIDG